MNLALALTFAVSTVSPAMSEKFDCQLIHVVENEVDRFERKFEMTDTGESRGGDEKTFAQGAFKIVLTADAHWMGLSWFENERVIASGVFVVSEISANRVIILADPTHLEDRQVSLNCSLQPGRFLSKKGLK